MTSIARKKWSETAQDRETWKRMKDTYLQESRTTDDREKRKEEEFTYEKTRLKLYTTGIKESSRKKFDHRTPNGQNIMVHGAVLVKQCR